MIISIYKYHHLFSENWLLCFGEIQVNEYIYNLTMLSAKQASLVVQKVKDSPAMWETWV